MKFKLKKVNSSYLLELDGYGTPTVEIDGKRIKEFKEGWLEFKPKSIKSIKPARRVITYGKLSIEKFEEEKQKLEERDSEGDLYFTDIDKEYAYKKFVQENPPVYEEYELIEDVELIEYEFTGKTDNPFIIPYRFIGKEPNDKDDAVLYRYEPNAYKMAQIITAELGLEEIDQPKFSDPDTKGMKWSVPDHSKNDLKFTKVNGNYTNYDSLPKFYAITCGTYEECQKRYEEHFRSIKSMFLREIKLINAEGMKFDKAKVLKELEFIKNLVWKIDAKSRSDIQPYIVKNRIQKFIDEL